MSEPHVPIESLLAHADWARALARRLVSDDVADDVVQETWLAALRSPPHAAARGTGRAWLATVLRNVVRRRARAAARRTAHEHAAALEPATRERAAPGARETTAAGEIVARAEAHRRVVDAVLALDEPYRATVLLRWFDGLAVGEIAARTGTPVETVRTRLRRALERLRGDLRERADGDNAAWRAALLPLTGRFPSHGAAGTAASAATLTGGLVALSGTTKAVLVGAVVAVAATAWFVAAGDGRGAAPLPPRDVADADTPDARETRAAARAGGDAAGPAAANATAASAAAAAESATLRVEVVDADGAAATHALVVAFDGDRVLAAATTDATGAAAIDVAPPARVAVCADGHPIRIAALDPAGTTRIELPAGLELAGLVRVDGAAPPEPLVLVLRTELPVERFGDLPPAVRARLVADDHDPAELRATTDAAGRFRFTGLPRATAARIVAPLGTAFGDAPAWDVEIPARDVLLRLTALATVRGRIVGDDGAPLAGVAGVTFAGADGVEVEALRRAGDDGRFAVALPERRVRTATLRVADADGLRERTVALDALEPGVRDVGDVALPQARALDVLVHDTRGRPVEGACAARPWSSKALADASDGSGRMALPRGAHETKLVVAALGFAAVEFVVGEDDAGPLQVTLAPATLLHVRVTAGAGGALPAALEVRVHASDGGAASACDPRLAGAYVAAGGATPLDAEDDDGSADTARFAVDATGRATLATLPAERPLEVALVDAFGVTHARADVRLAAGAPREVDLRIDRAARTFRARIVGADGAPVPGARVTLTAHDADGAGVVVVADAEGRVEVPGVATDALRAVIVAERHAIATFEHLTPRDDELALALEPATTLRVRVLAADGTPVANALVSMRLPPPVGSERGIARLARRVEDGVYELRDVPHAPTTVVVRVAGVSQTFTVDGRDGEATLRLEE